MRGSAVRLGKAGEGARSVVVRWLSFFNRAEARADGACMRDWLELPFSNAGRSARLRFNELASRWRRRALGPLRRFTAIVLPVLVVGAVFERHYASWALGLATGAVVALFMSIRDEVPAHIEAWRAGYMGERKTARVLAPLRQQTRSAAA